MAKNSMMKKPQPSPLRLWFHIDPANNTNYVDLALACSAASRRFVRQGTSFAVSGMTLHTESTVTGSFDVSKVPDTWMAQQAHKKSKMLWMESQDQVLDVQPTVAARYRDFKVYLDANMVLSSLQDTSGNAALDGNILLPVDRQNFTAKPGEWTYSQLQLPVDGGSLPPVEYNMHFVGSDANQSLGMISGYGKSRSRPQTIEPNTPTDGGWMIEVFDVADNLDEIRLDVTDNNDVPPYRVGDEQSADEFYPGGVNNQPSTALHSVNFVSGTTVGGKTRVEGGVFNCGLIRFDWTLAPGGSTSMYLAIDLVPGQYKGYLTEAF
jgi:hypothetical protein